MEGSPFKAYQIANILSLDVVMGAIVSSCFISTFFSVTLSGWHYMALGATVWIIYTGDHLLDAKRAGRPASTLRHTFHQRYFHVMLIGVVIMVVVDILVISQLSREIMKAGIVLIIPIGLYLMLQRFLSFFKELVGAAFYTVGISMPTVVNSHFLFSSLEIIIVIHFLLVAWMNLLLFSFFDKAPDQLDQRVSFATELGERTTKLMILILYSTTLVLTMIEYFWFGEYSGFVLFIMGSILVSMVAFRRFFETSDRYRLIGDAVFFLPIFYCFYDTQAFNWI